MAKKKASVSKPHRTQAKNNQLKMNLVVMGISIVIFVIGLFAINWIASLIIVGVLDIIYFTYPILARSALNAKPTVSSKKSESVKKVSNSKIKTDKNKVVVRDYKSKATPKKKAEKGKKKTKKKALKIILIVFAGFFLLGVVAVVGFIILIVTTAPEFDPENLYMKEASVLLANDNTVFARLGDEKREIISYEEMPEVLIDALIATEDSRFFQHNGFDLPRFLKASLGQLLGNSGAGGASTLTMQIAKNNYTSTVDEGFEGIKRKFTDIYMAIFKIEKEYSKKQIIEFYLNSYELGEMAFGVEQASLVYFDKSAKDLNLAEAAMIVGLFNAPSAYNPFVYPEDAEDRRQTVLYLMKRHGYINDEEYEIAKSMHVTTLLSKNTSSRNPYRGFIDTVVQEIRDVLEIDPYRTSLEIYTTLDRTKQDHVNNVFNGEWFTWENDVVNAGTAVVDVNTGAIVAIGGGRNQTNAMEFNRATMISRQIGSSAKPLYDYGPAIEYNGWSTATLYVDEPHKYSTGLAINNWDNQFNGQMDMRTALVGSRNIPALKTFQATDNASIYKFVKGLGLHPESTDGFIHESHSLGGYTGESPLSMATAYAAFGNGGYYNEPHSFTKVVYRDTGETVERNPKHERAMSEATAYMVADMLVDTAKSALYQWADINGAVYGAKTGTSNFSDKIISDNNMPRNAINDLWVVGTSPEYAIAVWYGYDEIDPNGQNVTRFGNRECYKLFQAVGRGMFHTTTGFTKKDEVSVVTVERDTNPLKLPSEFTPDYMKTTGLFKKGTEPTEVSTRYSKLETPKNPDHTLNGNTINLTWSNISKPDGINIDLITKQLKTYYFTDEYLNMALNNRIYQNDTTLGTVGYNVYIKTSSGWNLLGYTGNNKYTYTVNSNEPVTFGIASVYSIFKANESDMVEYTVNVSGVTVISSEFVNPVNGTTLNLNVGDTFNALNYIAIYEGSNRVNNISSYVTYNPTTINTSGPGEYTVKYTINYKTYTKTHNLTVKVT